MKAVIQEKPVIKEKIPGEPTQENKKMKMLEEKVEEL